MVPRERSFWAALSLVLYVGAAHLRAGPTDARAWVGLVVGPLALLVGFRLASAPPLGADWIEPGARRAGRGVASGVVLALVAELAPPTPGFVAVRALGLALAMVSAPLALARIAPLGATSRVVVGRTDEVFACGLLWLGAVGLAAGRALLGGHRIDAVTVDYAVVAASLGSIGIGIVAAFRVYSARRFELGVPERAAGAIWLGVVCRAVGAIASLMEVAAPERIVPLAALLASTASASCAISQRPELVARVLRLAAAVTMLATPLMSVAVVAAYKAPTHAGAIVFVVTAVAVAVGMSAPSIAERLAPEQGRWMRVLERAIFAAKAPEPRQAVTLALSEIRDGLGAESGPAVLHRFASGDRLTVDRAGYLHAEAGEVPQGLVDRVLKEPERVLSVEALRSLEVRQADVRPSISWLDDHRLGAVALVLDDDIPVGMLAWPAAGRVSPLAFEEVRALRTLADHLGVATGAEARLDRSREREVAIERGMGRAAEELRALRERLAREGVRQRATTQWLAARARVASYGPAIQVALGQAKQLAETGRPLALIERPGSDVLAWAALVHLASPRQDGPMLVVDGSQREEHALERWTDASTSPLELARGGTLVLLDARSLPLQVQRAVATAWRTDVGLVVVVPQAPLELDPDSALDGHLSALVGERVIAPPRLADRAEDLRALALDELARIGMRLRGEPLGLSLEAQRLLVEHEWPGNELEFRAVLLLAARHAEGRVVGEDALRRAMSDSGPGPLAEGPGSRVATGGRT